MVRIETERLIIRNYRTTDLQDVFAYFSNEEVSRYEDFYPMTEEEVYNTINEWKDMDNRLVAELKSGNIVIGSIGYWTDDEGHHCLDYDFNPRYGGHGYATEAGKALVRYLFETVGVNHVYADCDVNNASSWKLLERLGFHRMKQLDNQSYKDNMNGNPILISIFLYELEKNDFLCCGSMKIYEPFRIKNISFKNRIAMAAVTRYGYTACHGVMDERQVAEYVELAGKGIGLIFSPSLTIEDNEATHQAPGVYSTEHVQYLRTLSDACHKGDTRFFVQLSLHGYSIYDTESIARINAFTIEELNTIKEEYVRAAKMCMEAGADGIEIHGAHGFFLNLMTSALTNTRKDCYGGDLEGRTAFVREIVSAIKEAVGDNLLISYRMGWTTGLEEDIQLAHILEDTGIDILNVSSGIPADRIVNLPTDYQYSPITYVGSQVKKEVKIPVIVVDQIATIQRGNQLLEEDACDFAAYARPFLVDSSFAVKSGNNKNYRPCLGCKTCQWFSNADKCPVYNKNI